jgi:ketosteroid isomerase-like protein
LRWSSFISGIAALALTAAANVAGATSVATRDVIAFEKSFSDAVQANDERSVSRLTSPDWRIISGDGGVINRERFLAVIASGKLKHDALSPIGRATIRVYGHTALATSRVQSRGSYDGAPFKSDEIGTDILVKDGDRWRCVLTQLTAVTKP